MINRIKLEKSKLKETNIDSKELDKKVEELHNRYKDEKAKVVPIKVNELKEESNNLINNLNTQVKNKKDINEVNKILNSVENKTEELKKYKKVALAENTLKEIKNDLKNGKEVDPSKIIKLKDEVDKSIKSEEIIENEFVENMNEDEKALFSNEGILKINNNELLEKESKENKKFLAIKVGATVGTILLGASAFVINRRFRKK